MLLIQKNNKGEQDYFTVTLNWLMKKYIQIVVSPYSVPDFFPPIFKQMSHAYTTKLDPFCQEDIVSQCERDVHSEGSEQIRIIKKQSLTDTPTSLFVQQASILEKLRKSEKVIKNLHKKKE